MPIALVPKLRDLLQVAEEYNVGEQNSRIRLEVEQHHFVKPAEWLFGLTQLALVSLKLLR